jgi:hypothetical protein
MLRFNVNELFFFILFIRYLYIYIISKNHRLFLCGFIKKKTIRVFLEWINSANPAKDCFKCTGNLNKAFYSVTLALRIYCFNAVRYICVIFLHWHTFFTHSFSIFADDSLIMFKTSKLPPVTDYVELTGC